MGGADLGVGIDLAVGINSSVDLEFDEEPDVDLVLELDPELDDEPDADLDAGMVDVEWLPVTWDVTAQQARSISCHGQRMQSRT